MNTCYVNGSFCTEEEAKISPFDLGLMRGWGVFEHFRTYEKQPLFLTKRLARLQYAAEKTHIPFPDLEEPIAHLIETSPYEELRIYILLTKQSKIILTKPFEPYPQSLYEQGMSAITTLAMRTLPEIKTTSYLPALLTLEETGADEALYVNTNGEILEGSMSNFFALIDGKWVTADLGSILPGITRELLLPILEPLEIRAPCLEEIPHFEEAFITASLKEVVPITSINNIPINNCKSGKRTRAIHQSYKRLLDLEKGRKLLV